VNRQVVLDTNAYSHLFRGDERVLEVLGKAERVYVPVTVIGELLAGFRMGSREERNRKELAEFLAKPTVRVLETSEEVADVYAGLVAGLREAGRKVPTNDVWIAAHAMAVGGVLVSFDAHFEAVAGLRRWRGGE
jgi:tRNA(fMet)-specific endonuclease VapC